MNLKDFISTGQSRYDAVLSRLIKCPRLQLSHLGDKDSPVLRARLNPGETRPVFVVAGLHGDEIGGVTGLVDFLCSESLPKDISVDFFPVLNPSGFMSGTRRKDGVDINRDMCKSRMQPESSILVKALSEDKPSLLATLHEDGSQPFFYMYYSDEGRKPLWDRMARLASDYFDLGYGDVHGDDCVNGLIRHPSQSRVESSPKHLCSMENAAKSMGVDYVTTETPMGASLATRTLANRKLIQMLLQSMS